MVIDRCLQGSAPQSLPPLSEIYRHGLSTQPSPAQDISQPSTAELSPSLPHSSPQSVQLIAQPTPVHSQSSLQSSLVVELFLAYSLTKPSPQSVQPIAQPSCLALSSLQPSLPQPSPQSSTSLCTQIVSSQVLLCPILTLLGLYIATILLAYAPKYFAVRPGIVIQEHQCAQKNITQIIVVVICTAAPECHGEHTERRIMTKKTSCYLKYFVVCS